MGSVSLSLARRIALRGPAVPAAYACEITKGLEKKIFRSASSVPCLGAAARACPPSAHPRRWCVARALAPTFLPDGGPRNCRMIFVPFRNSPPVVAY